MSGLYAIKEKSVEQLNNSNYFLRKNTAQNWMTNRRERVSSFLPFNYTTVIEF